MRVRLPDGGRGSSRRRFLECAAGGAAGLLASPAVHPASACEVQVTGAWSLESWERRTIAHFLNTIVPGDHGRALFSGDPHPLDSGGDATAGAWSSCTLDVFYDPFHGVGRGARQLATALDWITRLRRYGWNFYRASLEQQLEVVDALARTPARADLRRAAALALAGSLGAAVNPAVANAIGWPGPSGGYYEGSRHPLARWRQPERLTSDGNLP